MIERFLDRKYDDKRYNCGHFASELWFELTGEKKYQLCEQGLQDCVSSLIRLPEIENPCIVLLKADCLHSGVFYDGFLYHLMQNGVQSHPINLIEQMYKIIGFYK